MNEAMFPQHPKTILSADLVLLRTQYLATFAKPINTPSSATKCLIDDSTRGLPGPLSRDDDEDSSPHVLDLNQADPVLCFNPDWTPLGFGSINALTQHGLLMAAHAVGTDPHGLVTTGSNQKNEAKSHHLSGRDPEVAKNSHLSGNHQSVSQNTQTLISANRAYTKCSHANCESVHKVYVAK